MILPLRVFGSASVKRISSGLAKPPISCADPLAQFLAQLVVVAVALLQGDEAADGLAGDLVRLADHRRFGHRRMAHQRATRFPWCSGGGR